MIRVTAGKRQIQSVYIASNLDGGKYETLQFLKDLIVSDCKRHVSRKK